MMSGDDARSDRTAEYRQFWGEVYLNGEAAAEGRERGESAYVVCPATTTSPAPDPGLGLPPNMPCGERVPVLQMGAVMEFRCPRGHHFYATPERVIREGDSAGDSGEPQPRGHA